MDNQESYPIHSFPKNNDEEVRLSVRKFKGKYYIDLRIWYHPENEEVFRPTKKGVFFSLEQVMELKKGVERLLKAAEKFKTAKEPEEIEV